MSYYGGSPLGRVRTQVVERGRVLRAECGSWLRGSCACQPAHVLMHPAHGVTVRDDHGVGRFEQGVPGFRAVRFALGCYALRVLTVLAAQRSAARNRPGCPRGGV
jgi:hypothetical protein